MIFNIQEWSDNFKRKAWEILPEFDFKVEFDKRYGKKNGIIITASKRVEIDDVTNIPDFDSILKQFGDF